VNRPTRLKLNNNVQSSRKKEAEAEEKFESTLSQEQLQALEEENNSLLEGFERTLDQIKYIPPTLQTSLMNRGTEKALLEISALQNELMAHLTTQELLTDRLYDDALATTDSVEKGNKQLVRAKQRHKSTTKFVLVFLLVMTLLLLFLDAWY
jgi:syntaxin 18